MKLANRELDLKGFFLLNNDLHLAELKCCIVRNDLKQVKRKESARNKSAENQDQQEITTWLDWKLKRGRKMTNADAAHISQRSFAMGTDLVRLESYSSQITKNDPIVYIKQLRISTLAISATYSPRRREKKSTQASTTPFIWQCRVSYCSMCEAWCEAWRRHTWIKLSQSFH